MRIGVYLSFVAPLFLPLFCAAAGQPPMKTLHHSTLLKASDNNGDGFFGVGVAIAGDVVVVGANNQGPLLGDGQPSRQGAAYVYLKTGKTWKQVAELTSSNPMDGESVGSTVAISSDGNTIFAGAPANQYGAMQTAGSIYVFVKPSGGWTSMTQTAKLTSPGTQYMAGWITASTDGTTVVGGSSGTSSYVFVEPKGGWADMSAATATLADPSGWGSGNNPNNYPTISGDGSTVAVGSLPEAPNYDGNVFVYERPTGGWQGTVQLTATLLPSDSNPPQGYSDDFGIPAAVANDGSLIATGAANNNNFKGEGYVYVRPAGGWADMTQTARISPPPNVPGEQPNSFFFGTPQAISGSTVLIGWTALVLKNKNTNETYCICGGAFGFEEPRGGWHDTQTANFSLQPKPLVSSDVSVFNFGNSIAADAGTNTVVVGAPASWYQGQPIQFFPGLSYVFDMNK